jgi:hypothetical protein
MDTLLLLLAVIGFLAMARVAARAAFRLLHRGVEAFIAAEAGATHARRGDITALQESQDARRRARRARFLAAATFIVSMALLIGPLFSPWTRIVYALFSPLLLLPARKRA